VWGFRVARRVFAFSPACSAAWSGRRCHYRGPEERDGFGTVDLFADGWIWASDTASGGMGSVPWIGIQRSLVNSDHIKSWP
jgi:hypothetical protein